MTGGIGWNLWHRLCKTQYIVRGVDVSYKFWGWGVAKPARTIYIYIAQAKPIQYDLTTATIHEIMVTSIGHLIGSVTIRINLIKKGFTS